MAYSCPGRRGSGRYLLFHARRQERNAFLSSCLYIVATLGGAAFGLYPALLPSSGDPANSLTIRNAAAAQRRSQR